MSAAETAERPAAYVEPVEETAFWRARRVRVLLGVLERHLGEDRIGSFEFDSTLRNLLDVACEETAALCKQLEEA